MSVLAICQAKHDRINICIRVYDPNARRQSGYILMPPKSVSNNLRKLAVV